MTAATPAKGQRAEQAVARVLQDMGYELCAANYLVPKLGELDLVVKRDCTLTVVEVKARHHAEKYGGLPATITPAKLRRMRKTAWCFLKEKQMMNFDVSFLAAFVKIGRQGTVESVELVPIECL